MCAYAVLGAPLLAVPVLVTTVLEATRSYFMFLEKVFRTWQPRVHTYGYVLYIAPSGIETKVTTV